MTNGYIIRSVLDDHHLSMVPKNSDQDQRRRQAKRRARGQALSVSAAGVIISSLGVHIAEPGGLIQSVSVVAGFLFAMLIWVLQAAATAANAPDGERTESHYNKVNYLDQLTANISYAAVLSVATTAYLSLGLFTLETTRLAGFRSWAFTAGSVALLLQLGLTLVLVIQHAYAEANGLISDARQATRS